MSTSVPIPPVQYTDNDMKTENKLSHNEVLCRV